MYIFLICDIYYILEAIHIVLKNSKLKNLLLMLFTVIVIALSNHLYNVNKFYVFQKYLLSKEKMIGQAFSKDLVLYNYVQKYLINYFELALEMTQFIENIDESYKIDFCTQYIISHIDEYKMKITKSNGEYIYLEDETPYYIQGYIDDKILEELSYEIFHTKELNIEGHPYYDKKKEMLALVYHRGEPLFIDSIEIISINNVIADSEIKVIVKCTRSFGNEQSFFLVECTLDNAKTNELVENYKCYFKQIRILEG